MASRISNWNYINLRRSFVDFERCIDRGTRWVVFEPKRERNIHISGRFLLKVPARESAEAAAHEAVGAADANDIRSAQHN